MQGSKYTDEQRETVLALFARGCSPAKVARETGIPRATVSDWRARALEGGDEDYLAARREKLRRLMGKSWAIVDHGLNALEKTVKAADTAGAKAYKVLDAVAKSGEVDADTAKELTKLLRDFGSVTVTELTRASGEAMKIYDSLESALEGGTAGVQQISIAFDDAQGLAE